MDKNSLRLENLKNKYLYTKRTKLQNTVNISWLKKRFSKNVHQKYLHLPEKFNQLKNIKKIFDFFDYDNSQSIEVSDLLSNFKDNNINISKKKLEELFSLINPYSYKSFCFFYLHFFSENFLIVKNLILKHF